MSARRRKRSAAARIRPFWMPIALGGAAVVIALVVAALWPGFDPEVINVSGNQRVSSGQILSRAAIASHESIWLQNTGAIEARIEAIPYIATASIHRIPPSAIAIEVRERVPFAILRSGDDAVVVDRALRVLAPAGDAEADAGARPVFVVKPGLDLAMGRFATTRDALSLRDAYDAMAAKRIEPLELSLDRFGGLVVTLPGGLRLLLGSETDLERKLGLAQAILAQLVHDRRRVAAIDLRAPATPVLIYR